MFVNNKDTFKDSDSIKPKNNESRKDPIFKHSKSKSRGNSSYGSYGSYGSTGSSKGGSLATNRFSVVEAYKTLRTNLQFSMSKKGCNVIIITSTMPRDGKSTVAANIAVAFAQTDIRVLIIDCDMRKPRVNKFFNIAAVPGLSNILAGLCTIQEGVQATEYKNLSIVSAGILPPNPAELLTSAAMDELVKTLRLEYDLIIMDTPPVNIVSDAVVITKIADGVVLVVRHAVTTHPDVERAIKSLEFVQAKIIGLVLNAVDYSKIYGKRYGYYSKGRYGSNYSGGYGSYGNNGSRGSYGDNHNQPDMATAPASSDNSTTKENTTCSSSVSEKNR